MFWFTRSQSHHDCRINIKTEKITTQLFYFFPGTRSYIKSTMIKSPLTVLQHYEAPKLKSGIVLPHWVNQNADGVAGQTTAHRSNLILLITVHWRYDRMDWSIRQTVSFSFNHLCMQLTVLCFFSPWDIIQKSDLIDKAYTYYLFLKFYKNRLILSKLTMHF